MPSITGRTNLAAETMLIDVSQVVGVVICTREARPVFFCDGEVDLEVWLSVINHVVLNEWDLSHNNDLLSRQVILLDSIPENNFRKPVGINLRRVGSDGTPDDKRSTLH